MCKEYLSYKAQVVQEKNRKASYLVPGRVGMHPMTHHGLKHSHIIDGKPIKSNHVYPKYIYFEPRSLPGTNICI